MWKCFYTTFIYESLFCLLQFTSNFTIYRKQYLRIWSPNLYPICFFFSYFDFSYQNYRTGYKRAARKLSLFLNQLKKSENTDYECIQWELEVVRVRKLNWIVKLRLKIKSRGEHNTFDETMFIYNIFQWLLVVIFMVLIMK